MSWSHSSSRDRPALAGVLVPLPNTSLHGDNSELTLGEHQFQLVHVRTASSTSGSTVTAASASLNAYLRAGGQLFPTIPVGIAAQFGDSSALVATASSDGLPTRSPSPLASPSPSIGGARKKSTFQLYANPEDNPISPRAQQPSTLSQLIPNLTSTVTSVAPQFIPFTSPSRSSSESDSSDASSSVVRAMHTHPTLPIIALLIKDEIYFYDIFGGNDSSNSNSVSMDRGSLVNGSWVSRTLRHPFMTGTQCIKFNSVGGNMIAAGTSAGLICLWQLVSVPSASASTNGATIGGAANTTRRNGAWLFVLQDAHHANQPIDTLEFSPCGRYLISASSHSNTFLIWDVSLAVGTAGEPGVSPAATPMSKLFSSILEPHHGIDFVRFNASGSALAVASHPRPDVGLISRGVNALVQMAVNTSKTVWKKVRGGGGSRKRKQPEDPTSPTNPDVDVDEQTIQSKPASTAAAKLPAGTLTIWNTHNWTHQSWQTSSPLTSICWSTTATAPNSSIIDSSLVLLSLQGSHIIQSLQLSSIISALANSSIRINCEPVDGIPTTRQPTDPNIDAIDRFRIGGAVKQCLWSPSEKRLAVMFEDCEEGSELIALFSLQMDATCTFQVLPIGMIRGPVCLCQGQLHPYQSTQNECNDQDRSGPRPIGSPMDLDTAAMERKYSDSDESPARVYPSLTFQQTAPELEMPLTCRVKNVPVHMNWLNDSQAGELLVISYKFGQVTFVPMYFGRDK